MIPLLFCGVVCVVLGVALYERRHHDARFVLGGRTVGSIEAWGVALVSVGIVLAGLAVFASGP